MKNRHLIIIFLLVLISCQPGNSSESRLRQRVTQYHQLMIKGDFDPTWDMLWSRSRRRHSWESWMLFCQESAADSKLIEFHIDSLSISKLNKHSYGAKVKISVKYKINRINKIESSAGEDEWVFENGDWFRYID